MVGMNLKRTDRIILGGVQNIFVVFIGKSWSLGCKIWIQKMKSEMIAVVCKNYDRLVIICCVRSYLEVVNKIFVYRVTVINLVHTPKVEWI